MIQKRAALTSEQKQLAVDYLMTFGTDQGRRVLEDLGRRFYVDESTMGFPRHGLPRGDGMEFREGSRYVVLEIKREIARAKLGEKPIQTVALTEPKKEE